MYKLYIAAPWIDRERMPEIAAKFEAEGHIITHKWWEFEDTQESESTHDRLQEQAINDLDGVSRADILILINSSKSEGKAVEQGIALAHALPIIAVGKLGDGTSKNVFHHLDNYVWVNTVEEAVDACRT
jgi:nucleoside 2-deoxyribosyltransferase